MTLLNILVIILFVLLIVTVTTASCANFKPHSADTVFEKHSKFEGFANNGQLLDYSNKDTNKMVDTNKQYLIKPEAECKKILDLMVYTAHQKVNQ